MLNIVLFLLAICFVTVFIGSIFFISECVGLVCVPMDSDIKNRVKLPFSVVKTLIENSDNNTIGYTLSYSKLHITYRRGFYTTIEIYLSLKDYFLYRKFLYVFCKKSKNQYFPKNTEVIKAAINEIENSKSN